MNSLLFLLLELFPEAIDRNGSGDLPQKGEEVIPGFMWRDSTPRLVVGVVLAFFGVDPNQQLNNFDFFDALGISMSSLSNVGPGMGYYGPVHSWAILTPIAKFTCSFLMLVGRLEIFPVLILFSHSFWKKA